MQALQLIRNGQPLELREVDPDPVGPADVLVEVAAAGICHSDVHYRSGPLGPRAFPITLGHEVAGTIIAVGDDIDDERIGERVCLHYQSFCGSCRWCRAGSEQFCEQGRMIGNSRPGGYAEYITVPSVNAVNLPDPIPFAHGAVMMCSSATSLHALRRARLAPGESVAVFGAGGLGMSAVQLAKALGAGEVFAVDVNPERLELAAGFGAVPIDAATDAVRAIREATDGAGVDVAVEVIGLGKTMKQALDVLGKRGRAAIVGLSVDAIQLAPFAELAGREAEMIGVSDHLLAEIPELLGFYLDGALDLGEVVGQTIPLDADAVNAVMDEMERFGGAVRSVIIP